MGSKRIMKNAAAKAPASSVAPQQTQLLSQDDTEEFISEEEYRKKFEPVAPWKRKDIPDHGPLHDQQHVLIFIGVGIAATLLYELTDYFNEIHRVFAYVAIWFPLWFRLLSRVSPALTDEERDAREQLAFQRELDRLANEQDEVDD